MIKVKIDRNIYKRITSINEIYDVVASTLGAYDLDKCRYDCTKVEVSTNLRECVEQAYGEEGGDAFAMAWVCFGPKENEELQENTVAIADGFIKEEDNI